MLTDLCQELRNWFDRYQPKWYGEFKIENGALVLRDDMSLKDGQYFRIIGSALNEGIYRYGSAPIGIYTEDGQYIGSVDFVMEDGSLIYLTDKTRGLKELKFDIVDGRLFKILESSSVFPIADYEIVDGRMIQKSTGKSLYYRYQMEDETFTGAIWAMAVPPSVIALSDEIDQWVAKYGGIESPNMSPYQSESFGGYSYNKGYSGNSGSGSSSVSWQDTFRSKLNRWRKI